MNTNLNAVTEPDCHPIRIFMTTGQGRDYSKAAALQDRRRKADWMLADGGYDANWFREAPAYKGKMPCILCRKAHGTTIKNCKECQKLRNGIKLTARRPKGWRCISTRYDRSPKAFFSAVAVTAPVMFRP